MGNANINRCHEIMAHITAFNKEAYHKADLLPELLELQKQLVYLVFNVTHAEFSSLRIWDVERHLEQMNESCNHPADALLMKVEDKCKLICNMIKSEFSGNAGERKAFWSMDTIRNKKEVLKNVELQSGNHRTELDGIVFTESAVFIIEVKNPGKDIYIDERGNYCRVGTTMHFDKNIGERMNEKAYLLKKTLTNSGITDPVIESIVVFTNNTIRVDNNYPYINTCFLSDMPHIIEQYSNGSHYSDADIRRMVDTVKAAQCHEAYPIPIDMGSFKRDFASLLAILEESTMAAAEGHTAQGDTDAATSQLHAEDATPVEAIKSIRDDQHSKIVVGIGALITITGAIGALVYRTLKH